MPPSELQRKFRALRGRLRRLVVLVGLSRLTLVVVAALALALLVDWTSKLETPGRLVLLALAGAATLAALWRYLVAPLRVRLGNEEMALLVERHFPDLRDRLISTVQFARAAEVAPLSQAMVEQLTQDTLEQALPLDFEQVSTARRPAWWAVAAGLALALACLYTMLFPAAAAVFASRFFDPFSSVEWPRRTQLNVLAYDKDNHQLPYEGTRIFVPKGEDLDLVVRASRHSGRLWRPPSRIAIYYDFAAGGSGRRNAPMGDPATYRSAFPTVTENFSFYVIGDDARTQTYQVEIRNRPRIESIRITLRAPAYTGEPERVQADGRGGIVGLAGSLAVLEATTNKPVAAAPGSARIFVDDQLAGPMAFVGGDPTRLRGDFRLRAGQKQYAIKFVDTEGLASSPPATYRLDVRPDRAPVVRLPQPGKSKKVTPKAVVPVEVAAEDDFAVRHVRFLFQRDEKSKPVVHAFPDPAEAEKKTPARTLDWDLTVLALKEGDVLKVYAEAEDFYAETLDGKEMGPNIGRSPAYNLTVISEAEMASLLRREQQELKERLKKLIGRQEESKADVERLATTKDEPIDRRKVTLAERDQRKVAASATDVTSGLENVLTEMKNNKVGNLAEQRRAESLARILRELAERDMPDAARRIAGAAQTNKLPEQQKSLADAAAKQQDILDTLRGALAQFDQWHDIDELLRDASELLLTQKKLNDRTAELARKLLGKPADKLTPAEKGAARSLARSEQGARDAMQALETKMAEVARKLAETDPAASKIVDQALSQATSDQIRKRMDDAGSHIDQGRPASARPLQAQATDALQKLVDTLSRARSPYLARDLRRLQEDIRKQMEQLDKLLKQERGHLGETAVANLRRQLRKLRDAQAATKAATEKAASDKDLTQQAADQASHAEQANSLAQQAEQLAQNDPSNKDALTKAGQALQKAGQQMSQAKESLANANKGESTKAQDEALKNLDEADRHLARLQDQLAKAKAEKERLPERAKEQGETAKATGQTAQDIQQTAQSAQEMLPNTASSVQQAAQATSQAASSMSQAQQKLDQAAQQQDAGPPQQSQAQQDQQQAVKDLEQARDQLAKAHDDLDLRRRQQELFELEKALTAMLPRQVAIRETTQQLDAASEAGAKPLTHAQTLTLSDLADRQDTLHTEAADIVARLEREKVPVFLYVMQDAARGMTDVHKLLGESKIDWATQDQERDIERNILQLIDALKEEAQRLAKDQQPPQGGGGGGGGKPAPLVPPLAQLKQLRTLQIGINDGTRAVELEKVARQRFRERLLKIRADRLARKQQELGKLTEDFAKALEEAAQEQMTPH